MVFAGWLLRRYFFLNLAIGRCDYRVAPNFNERVVVYNLRMRELTQSTTSIELWRHRAMWANWANLLVDGLHFTDEGHRRYFNSVRGALVAAMNRLVGSVSLISCNYRNGRRFWWYCDHLSQSSSTLPAAGLWERLVRRGHVRCAAESWRFCLVVISAVLDVKLAYCRS